MEVKKLYIEFLLQLLNNEENIDIETHREDLIVNLYITLLSLSNLEYSDNIDQKEKEEISDFLRKLNNLKVKIQLKRKAEETNKLATELITQYYENVNILSIYIKDGIELENIITTMDPKSLTTLIDTVTKDKMNKEDNKVERNNRRIELLKLLPFNEYFIENNIIYIKNNDIYEEVTINEFINIFSYLLNPDNYTKVYPEASHQRAHELIIDNIIKILIINTKKPEEMDKIIIPMILTYILSLDITNNHNIDTSEFNIENIKINELYALAAKSQNQQDIFVKTPKWRNISIPNEYLLEKLKELIQNGMYYIKEDNFILEHIENNTSDFKISIKIESIKQFLKTILDNVLTTNYSKKNIK